jgi:phosphonate transport system ATP-binding protein
MTPAISVNSLKKTFNSCVALDSVSLTVNQGEMVALIGASGSGKSTLLRHIAGLAVSDEATGSSIRVHGRPVQSDGRLAPDVRDIRAGIGFVFQQFNLVDRLPVITNVLAGMLHRIPAWRGALKHFRNDEIRTGIDALTRVGMAERALQRASTLSGGQQQRAAIARTLVQRAKIILADEPIASLDPESSRKVMDILASINHEDKTTVLVSLHQVEIAIKYCPRTVALHKGRVVYDGPSVALTPTLLRELYGADAEEVLQKPDHAPEPAFIHPAYVEPAAHRNKSLVEAQAI